MRCLLKLVRYKNWYDSKWNCYFTIFLFYCLLNPSFSANFYIKSLAAILLLSCCVLAFGYAYNDFSDQIEDKIAGKPNGMLSLSKQSQIVLLLLFFIVGTVGVVLLFPTLKILSAALISFLFAFLYSNKRLSLKRNSVLGPAISSLAQRVIPLSVIFIIFDDWSLTSILISLWAFAVGLRWIFIHQSEDLENDAKSDTNTFVRKLDNPNLLKHITTGVFILEVFCLLLIYILHFDLLTGFATIVPACYLIMHLYLMPFWSNVGWERIIMSYDFAPMADFYYLWSGIFMVISLALTQPAWLVTIVAVIYFGYRYIILDVGYINLFNNAKRGMY